MPDPALPKDSLVLYKNRPARVLHVGDKIEIELEGKTLKVRPKDVTLLHLGPLQALDELQPQEGEVEIAWELLSGRRTSLAELAELVYGEYTPTTAWAAWQLLADGLYFQGTPEQVEARSREEVAQGQAAREAKAAEQRAWAAFLERVRTGQITPEDGPYLKEVEYVALGQSRKSRLLRELGRSESPENAHALLLRLGHWDHTVNPYPQRLGVASSAPRVELPGLPEEERVDLTHLPAFAIDDQGNQDPDDALSLEEGYLWVHIADVAALIPPNSAADLEARGRGASLYLPEGMVPMLPQQAVQILGMGLTEVSPALSFRLELGPAGDIVGIEVLPSWVRVTRVTYEEVEDRLDEEPFQGLRRLAQVHEARREENGAITIDLPEVKVRVKDGQVVIDPLPPLRSRDLVREAMLMAGEAIGRFALEHDILCPFTMQEPPETREWPEAEGMAGMYALRSTLLPSQQTTIPAPHAGLGLDVYTQCTSPLRRYLDLIVHQQLRAHLRGGGLLGPQEILERVGAATAVTGSVRQAERLACRHWTLVYLLQHPDWQGEGVLVERRGRRGTVLIPELDLQASIPLRRNLPLNNLVVLTLRGLNLAELDVHFQPISY